VGDARFDAVYARVQRATDRPGEIDRLSDADVIAALAGASKAKDPLLATAAQNRASHLRKIIDHLGEGASSSSTPKAKGSSPTRRPSAS